LKNGLVSVFIPSYNYERYIGAAIDSILSQSYPDWQLIVVDDASTDQSPAIIERYRRRYPERIRTILLQQNVGQSEATNIGLGLAEGEFVSFLAADDVARPRRLEAGMAVMKARSDVAAAFSRVAYIDAEGRPLPETQSPFNLDFADIRWQMLTGNFLCATSALVRLSALRNTGGFNRTLGYVEDYDLWLRLLDRFELVRVDDVWVDYRMHGENLSFAASRQDQRLGPLYESVAVAVRAMHRWPLERLHRFRHRPGTEDHRRDTASVQLRLAECCLSLEDNFFQQVRDAGLSSPGIGVAAAYGFVLDALQNDPASEAASNLLNRIYGTMGDTGRAKGSKSSTVRELQSIRSPASAATAASSRPTDTTTADTEARSAYERWAEMFNITRAEATVYDRMLATGGLATRFHLAIVLVPGRESDLINSIRSLTAQLHTNVLLTVVADGEAPPGFAGERVRWLQAIGDPLARVNESLLREDATWVGLVACGDSLADSALLLAAAAIDYHPEWQALYTDDDQIDDAGRLAAPRLKPDFDITLARATPYTDGLVIVRWDAFAAVGGFKLDMGEAAGHDLLLRVSERAPIPPVGHVAGPILHRSVANIADPEAYCRAIQAHLGRVGCQASIKVGSQPGTFQLDYLALEEPLVSMVIPTRDRLPMLSRCIESILERTSYSHYEIIVVDHECTSPDARQFVAGLAGLGDSKVRVVRHEGAFSLAALLNAGARNARGSQLLFLHDDVAALQPEWLEKLVVHAQRPNIGAVGARLLTADGRLQHAGIVLGLSGLADIVGNGAALDDSGYLGRFAHDQEVSAASAACLLVRRDAFETIGGYDEAEFPVFLTEVDLCLRLAKAGWRTVWTPQATLLHDGPLKLAEGVRSSPWLGADRASRWAAESNRLLDRWLPDLAYDPHYSRLQSLHLPAYRLCENPVLARTPHKHLPRNQRMYGKTTERDGESTLSPPLWCPNPHFLIHLADREGSGHYRIVQPAAALAAAAAASLCITTAPLSPPEMIQYSADAWIFQRQLTNVQIEAMDRYRRYGGGRMVYEIDDLITQIPEASPHRKDFPPEVIRLFRRAVGFCDRLVVSTQSLAQAFAGLAPETIVLPNYLPRSVWTALVPKQRQSPRPRIGWGGSVSHIGDLEMMVEVVEKLEREVDWIFFGLCPQALRGYAREIHPPVPFTGYAEALASLDLDIAIAPLQINAFNEAKSNLKLLEYGALGYPVICTDIVPYHCGLPVMRVKNRAKDWINAIRSLTNERNAREHAGAQLRAAVHADWMLEDHLEEVLRAWNPIA
jgi:glycosyltransferase involved in cell wall biosynthesis